MEKEPGESQTIIKINNNNFQLLAEKAVFWVERKALILADLHVGKAAHFRKNGIPISGEVSRNDFIKLYELLHKFKCKTLLVVGDIVHDKHNQECDDFNALMEHFPDLEFILVKGNHDKYLQKLYPSIIVKEKSYELENFVFCHEPLKEKEEGKFYFYGHLHPGVSLKGKAKQSLRLPCFHLGKDFLQLPAFSDFTGLYIIKPKKDEQLFVVAGKNVVDISLENN